MRCYKKDYPRPQFVRDNWENLNGVWDFYFDDKNIGEDEGWFEQFPAGLKINVPFTYETKLSGIQDETRHDYIWYHRGIVVDKALLKENDYILHFEGSDFYTKVWVNGRFAGEHTGGYTRFSFNISRLLKDGENEIVVKVEDSYDTQQPRGKQRWAKENFGCWYVQTTGIWKTVWSEYVPKVHIDYIKMTPNLQKYMLELEADIVTPEDLLDGTLTLETSVFYENELVNRVTNTILFKHTSIHMDVLVQKPKVFQWDCVTWTPEHPNLFDVEFRLLKGQEEVDKAGSYFAMREISIEGPNVLLNGEILYQRLILDQGYWPDSHLTPPSEEALIEDIEKIQALGYNGLRKHQKTEDERFLYWCDVKGMLVWSEYAAAYRYSDYAVNEFTKEWMEIVKQNYNHPCIIIWTPFNESWGVGRILENKEQQHFTEAIYHLTKSVDKMRPVIANDGWEHTVSDIITLHDYEAKGEILEKRYAERKDDILGSLLAHNKERLAFAAGYEYKGQPVIISEFGGIAFANEQTGWGYGDKVADKDDFVKRFDEITTAIKKLPYVCGYCYTQVSDVQQEINGLMDAERNFKVEPEIICEINKRQVGCYKI